MAAVSSKTKLSGHFFSYFLHAFYNVTNNYSPLATGYWTMLLSKLFCESAPRCIQLHDIPQGVKRLQTKETNCSR
jgi:hypothetical protein